LIVDSDGTEVGAHDGVDAFTIGQRRGVNVAVGERRYVVDIDTDAALVTVGARDALMRDRVRVRDLQFSAPGSSAMLVQTRAHGAATPAGFEGDEIVFGSPQPRVAPGQVVACYDGDICFGGGIAAA